MAHPSCDHDSEGSLILGLFPQLLLMCLYLGLHPPWGKKFTWLLISRLSRERASVTVQPAAQGTSWALVQRNDCGASTVSALTVVLLVTYMLAHSLISATSSWKEGVCIDSVGKSPAWPV